MISLFDLKMVFDEDGTPISGEIVFSHIDDKTGVVRHFAVERIVKWLETVNVQPEIMTFATDPIFAMFSLTHRGVEEHRFNRITPQDVIAYPIIMAHMPGVGRDVPGEHLIIDGIHRYCKATLDWGWTEMRAYVLEPEQWEQFLVDVPPELDDVTADRLKNQHIDPIDSRIK